MIKIPKFTLGMGDRFAHQGCAQLNAVVRAHQELGIKLYPVWNKSFREHTIVGSCPDDLRKEADDAVRALNWEGDYFVDADHISLKTVDAFLAGSNFYTLDVADFVNQEVDEKDTLTFLQYVEKYFGNLTVEGIASPLALDATVARSAAQKYLRAIQEAGALYRHIESKKGAGNFITEVSVDETDQAQSPVELFFILAMIAQQKIPSQTIAPKFTGRFNKGVDYVGDLAQFDKEFHEDLCILRFAIQEFGLPESLKLSVHSGSDKFSIYPIIRKHIQAHNAGLHLKTAGTTWLEEVIGLAESDGDGLKIAKNIYEQAYARLDKLSAPYATVIQIDPSKLPQPSTVNAWSAQQFVETLRHDLSCKHYNLHFRQLLHIAFKVAAEMGSVYTDALKLYRENIGRNVTENLFDRHIKRVF